MDARLALAAALALAPLALSCGGDPMAEETEAAEGEDLEDLGCPPGIERCPCADGECDPGLVCVEDTPGEGGICEPGEDCPIGALGCECTMGGECDGELVCEAGICSEDPGAEGNACNADGTCDLGLDCVDDVCVFPELPQEPHEGWGVMECWGPSETSAQVCYAPRGDAWERIIPACAFATGLGDGTITRSDTWTDGCLEGEPIGPEGPWSDAACFVIPATTTRCYGRLGEFWVEIHPDCEEELPSPDYLPWPINPDIYGCVGGDLQGSDADEWRCSDLQGCYARRGDLWTRSLPHCNMELLGFLALDGILPESYLPGCA